MRKFFKVFIFLISTHLYALDLELTQGINSALPIGISSFGSDTSAQQVYDIINNDLQFCGQFRLINLPGTTSSPAAWRQAGADSLVNGNVQAVGNNRYEIHFELMDTVGQNRLLLSKSFQVPSADIRPLAHHISDLIYEKLTGDKGIFSTKIAYVLVQRSDARTRYSLEVADVDGFNPQSLLISPEPIMSPSWSPDGRKIAYVSFEKKRAQVYIVSVETGKRQLVTDFPGINNAPSWSPDGRQLAVVLSKSGSPKIYTIDLASGAMKQVTFGDSIDTEPRYTPDGRFLLFTSGRGGSPQIYKMSLADGSINRVTFNGNYNARATMTPDQNHLVMFHRDESKFNIAVQDLSNGQVSTLTYAPLDESPSIAPNGRLILYATRYQDKGVLAVVSIDGRIRMRLPSRQGDVQEPAWSPSFG